MKIVIITTKMPVLESGSQVRNYYLAKALLQRYGRDVSLICITPELQNQNVQNLTSMQFGFISVRAMSLQTPAQRLVSLLKGHVPYVKNIKETIMTDEEQAIIRNADIIHIEELDGYFLVQKYLSQTKATIVLDAHNVDAHRFKFEIKEKSVFERLLGIYLIPTFEKYEKEAIQKVDYVLTCSSLDRIFFAQYKPVEKISVIPNGVDGSYFNTSISSNTHSILFMGLLSYKPNETGLKHFIENSFPAIRQQFPDTTLTVIGKNPPVWLQDIADQKSIIVTDFVADVRPFIQNTAVCICPVADGSGTRLKVLEYMAMGKPVVSTAIGAMGIQVTDKDNILIADTDSEFTKAIIDLFSDITYAQTIGNKAGNFVRKNYEWNGITECLIQLYENINAQ